MRVITIRQAARFGGLRHGHFRAKLKVSGRPLIGARVLHHPPMAFLARQVLPPGRNWKFVEEAVGSLDRRALDGPASAQRRERGPGQGFSTALLPFSGLQNCLANRVSAS